MRVQPRNRMRENCTSGTARGVPGNRHSYRRGLSSCLLKVNTFAAISLLDSGAVQHKRRCNMVEVTNTARQVRKFILNSFVNTGHAPNVGDIMAAVGLTRAAV